MAGGDTRDDLAAALSEFVVRERSGDAVELRGSLRVSLASDTFAAVLHSGGVSTDVVVKVGRRAAATQRLEREAVVLSHAAAGSGVPIPPIVDHGLLSEQSGRYVLITERVTGRSPDLERQRGESVDVSRRRERVRLMAASAPWIGDLWSDDLAGWTQRRTPRRDARRIADLLVASDALPIEPPGAVRCAALLFDDVPRPMTPRLLHGDFRTGNAVFDEEGLAALIDWEGWTVGDPRFDLATLIVAEHAAAFDGGSSVPDGLVDLVAEEFASSPPGEPLERLDWFVALAHCKAAGWCLSTARRSARAQPQPLRVNPVARGVGAFRRLKGHRPRHEIACATAGRHLERAEALLVGANRALRATQRSRVGGARC
ncbi:MAG: phosphotransferase [Acidimicrobiia bacterium]|nr:phosphotransferase [Acidimicrobiia bacterium]